MVDLRLLAGDFGFTLRGDQAGDHAGTSVARAGDINGDGIPDALIGAPEGDHPSRSNAGTTYVVFGSNAGFPPWIELRNLDGTDGFIIEGAAPNQESGSSVHAAGDVNGDGFDDLIVGAPNANRGDQPILRNVGAAFVVFGSDQPFPALLDLAVLDGTDGFVMRGIDMDDLAGFAVGAAGDVNLDGFDDVLVGANNAAPGGNVFAGEAYVVFGSDTPFPAEIDLGTLDGTNGFLMEGQAPGDWLGESLAGIGDLNGDAIDDIAICADGADPGGRVEAGSVYIVFGRDTGFPATLDLGALDGTDGFVVHGALAEDYAGESVSPAGDINGDGFDDVIIGVNGRDFREDVPGQACVIYGTDQGFPAVFDLSILDGSNGFVFEGAVNGDQTGYAVAGVGDVNGDGMDDILVGAFRADDGFEPSTGRSYVVFGRSTDFPASLHATDLDGGIGFRLDGIDRVDYAGFAVAGLGDFNDDGTDDFLIAAPNGDPVGRDTAGECYVVFGRPCICLRGTIDVAFGPAQDVLYVNGSTGGPERTVSVPDGNLVVVSMLTPPAGGNGRFVLHGDEGRPTLTSPTALPANIGTTCFPFLLNGGATPAVVANNIGKRALLGSSNVYGEPIDDPDPATTTFHLDPLPLGTTLTLQGAIIDPGSISHKGASTTNAVIVEIVP